MKKHKVFAWLSFSLALLLAVMIAGLPIIYFVERNRPCDDYFIRQNGSDIPVQPLCTELSFSKGWLLVLGLPDALFWAGFVYFRKKSKAVFPTVEPQRQ